MTQPTAQELAEMVDRLMRSNPLSWWSRYDQADELLERWHHSQLVFVTTPREWSVK